MFPLTKGVQIWCHFRDYKQILAWNIVGHCPTILRKGAHFLEKDETETVHNVGDETYLKGQKIEDIKISFVWLQLNFHTQKVVIKRI